MKHLNKYLTPLWFALLVYLFIRLLTDPLSERYIWERPWETTLIEIAGAILISYVAWYGIRKMIVRFNQSGLPENPRRQISNEVIQVLLFTLLITNLTVMPFMAATDDGLQLSDFIIGNFTIVFLVLLVFTYNRANQYINAFAEERARNERLQREKAEHELHYLRAQINPHFIFNALNSIYHTIDENAETSKQLLERFSELLRYQLYECSAERVPLKREIKFIEDYIELQRQRKNEDLQLDIHFDQQLDGWHVAPFLLQPLVENAFKFVGDPPQIHICGRITEEVFTFIVENSSSPAPAGKASAPGGIGLDNLRRRLELLYPGRHRLDIREEQAMFKVKLSLKFYQPDSH